MYGLALTLLGICNASCCYSQHQKEVCDIVSVASKLRVIRTIYYLVRLKTYKTYNIQDGSKTVFLWRSV